MWPIPSRFIHFTGGKLHFPPKKRVFCNQTNCSCLCSVFFGRRLLTGVTILISQYLRPITNSLFAKCSSQAESIRLGDTRKRCIRHPDRLATSGDQWCSCQLSLVNCVFLNWLHKPVDILLYCCSSPSISRAICRARHRFWNLHLEITTKCHHKESFIWISLKHQP